MRRSIYLALLAYSIFQQGAGLANALDAVYNTETGCANQGIDIDLDLAGVEHYGGRANQVLPALVARIDRHGGVAQHGFGAGGGHGDVTGAIIQWVPQVPHVAGHVLHLHFVIG